jgi:hypothetical protein
MPFLAIDDDNDEAPPIDLEQIDSKNFKVLTGFRYQADDGAARITVQAGESTDLASIPFFLRWFVGTYGRHTRAAILHDHMWRKPSDGLEKLAVDGTWAVVSEPIDKFTANRIFRDAMGEPLLRVGTAKRWIMWAAVTLDTIRTSGPAGLFIYAFLLLHIAADVLLFGAALGSHWTVIDGHHVFGLPLWIALAVLPAPLALLWGGHPVAGIIGTYALLGLVVPILVTLAALGLYVIVELGVVAVQFIRRLLGGDVGPIHGPSLTKVKSALLKLPHR